MSKASRSASKVSPTLAQNKKVFHDYFITERLEAGVVLQGWEVKSIRAGRAQLKESYVVIKDQEMWLLGMHITPLTTASTHIHADPIRTRKLLLHAKQISKLIGHVERKGFTLVPCSLYWKKNRLKLEIGLAEGKKQHDKRAAEKDRDWKRQQARIMRDQR